MSDPRLVNSLIPNSPQLSIELMHFLNKMNDNIVEIRERVIRIETQDYQFDIRELQKQLAVEVEKRRELSEKVTELKTKIAPILGGAVIVASIMFNVFTRFLHF